MEYNWKEKRRQAERKQKINILARLKNNIFKWCCRTQSWRGKVIASSSGNFFDRAIKICGSDIIIKYPVHVK